MTASHSPEVTIEKLGTKNVPKGGVFVDVIFDDDHCTPGVELTGFVRVVSRNKHIRIKKVEVEFCRLETWTCLPDKHARIHSEEPEEMSLSMCCVGKRISRKGLPTCKDMCDTSTRTRLLQEVVFEPRDALEGNQSRDEVREFSFCITVPPIPPPIKFTCPSGQRKVNLQYHVDALFHRHSKKAKNRTQLLRARSPPIEVLEPATATLAQFSPTVIGPPLVRELFNPAIPVVMPDPSAFVNTKEPIVLSPGGSVTIKVDLPEDTFSTFIAEPVVAMRCMAGRKMGVTFSQILMSLLPEKVLDGFCSPRSTDRTSSTRSDGFSSPSVPASLQSPVDEDAYSDEAGDPSPFDKVSMDSRSTRKTRSSASGTYSHESLLQYGRAFPCGMQYGLSSRESVTVIFAEQIPASAVYTTFEVRHFVRIYQKDALNSTGHCEILPVIVRPHGVTCATACM